MASFQEADLANVTLGYDASRGWLQSITQGTRSTTINYDASGRVESITQPGGPLGTHSVEFDYHGNSDRVWIERLPDGREIEFTYDDNGNVRFITPPDGLAHEFQYDGVNAVTRYVPPDVNVGEDATDFVYNLDHQLETVIFPSGEELDVVYLSDGRVDTIDIPRGTIDFGYDASGHLGAVAAPHGGVLTYVRDGSLLLAEHLADPVLGNASVEWGYDDRLRVNSEKVNAANEVTFAYDDDDLLTQAGDETLQRDPTNGLLSGTTLQGSTSAYGYNTYGELDSLSYSAGASEVFAQQVLERDGLGRVQRLSETVLGTTRELEYVYDAAGRLESVTEDGNPVADYVYDDNSNRYSETTPLGTRTATVLPQDRLESYGEFTYTYTPNGELETKTDTLTSDVTTYDYDVLGNLMAVDLPDGTRIDYIVDGRNRRIGKRVDGITTQTLVYGDQLNPVAEITAAGTARFVYGSRSHVPDYMTLGGVTYRIVHDTLGSVRLVLDLSTSPPTVVQQLDYDTWGNVLVDTNPGFQPFGFAGGIYDPDTELTRFGARDYDALTGRWTTKEPLAFAGGGTNFYQYSSSDPVNFLDTTGQHPGLGTDLRQHIAPVSQGAHDDVVATIAIIGTGVVVGILLAPELTAAAIIVGARIGATRVGAWLLGTSASGVTAVGVRGAAGGGGPRAFEIASRVAGQLKDPRLGSLAGKLTPRQLQTLVNNPAAQRVLDARTGHINVIQEVSGRLLRITVPRDAFKIISVGPIRARNVANSIANGRFVPLP